MVFHGQRVQKPRSGEQCVVAGGQDARQDDCVDDTAGSIRTRQLENEGKWGGNGASRA